MNQQPDKFFRNKLQGYQPAVSADAWRRVSDNLGGKRDGVVWLKIAAGLLLLAAAGVLIFTIEKNDPSTLVSEKTESNKKEEAAKEQKIIPQQKQDAVAEEIAAVPDPVVERKAKDANKPIEERRQLRPSDVKEITVDNNDVATTQTPQPEVAQHPEEKTSFAGNNALAVDQAAEKESVTIVFTAREVDEKYLNKKNIVADATPEVKETSTWRRLLDKAYDLKHNQDPMGDLRQKKNEILALNFKNDKQSHENQ